MKKAAQLDREIAKALVLKKVRTLFQSSAQHQAAGKETSATNLLKGAVRSATEAGISLKDFLDFAESALSRDPNTKERLHKLLAAQAPSFPVETLPAPPRGPLTPASLLRMVKRSLPLVGPAGRYGQEKVFIAALWDVLQRDPGMAGSGITIDKFKRWLLAANRDGDIRITRGDLVGAMDPTLVRRSEIDDHGTAFHFVMDR